MKTVFQKLRLAPQDVSCGFQGLAKGVAKGVAALVLAVSVTAGTSFVADTADAASYPKKKPRQAEWTFAGPFGKWDKAQLQRGLKVYTEVCAACHSMKLLSYRNLADLGYTEEQIKAYAAEFEVTDGPNDDGEMFDRTARPADRFVGPYANDKEAASANNGALPPDMSLIAKARAVERGFPTFIFDIFTMYAESGPDYIYSLLTGYPEETPDGVDVLDGLHYNPYFIAGTALAMSNPLSDDIVDYDDGTPQTVDQYAKDISAFLMWAAEPGLPDRKQRGFIVICFLLLFAGLLYFTKKRVWADVSH
ncbi:MAG: cytochrome c1 [Pseudomonadota bacterium]